MKVKKILNVIYAIKITRPSNICAGTWKHDITHPYHTIAHYATNDLQQKKNLKTTYTMPTHHQHPVPMHQ
jgi:hypothetical protein